MDALLHDLRYAVRSLRKSPGFTAVAVLTLALGIGANTAIFSVVNAVLLKPAPYPDSDRLYAFMTTFPEGSFDRASPTKFNTWRECATAFDDLSAYRFTAVNLTNGDEVEQVPAGQVTSAFFKLFGASMVQGRTFADDEDRPNGPHAVILSYGLWQRRFGGDADIIGKQVSISGAPHTVVGVVGRAFHMPEIVPAPDLWLPFGIAPNSVEQAHILWAAGRLKADRSLAEAHAQLQLAASTFRRKYPDLLGEHGGFGVELYQQVVVRDVRPSLLVLSGAVGFVLLIACANVANLLLVRAGTRRREIAVRAAIGAGRGRIVRQLLTESVLLGVIGGGLGGALGTTAMRPLLLLNPTSIPRIGPAAADVAVDARVLVFAAMISIVTGLVFGILPAFQVSGTDLTTTLNESGRSGSGSRDNRARAALVIGEVAVAVVLLVGATLLIRTLVALRTVNPGFSPEHVLTLRMSLTGPRFATTAEVAQFVRNGLERLRAVPGVVAASTTCCLPLEGRYGHLNFDIVGRPTVDRSFAGWISASSGYFDVFKIPLVRGRVFTERDHLNSPPVVIISESLARKYWPGGDPLNERLLIGQGMGPQFVEGPRQIVGVVGDVRESLGDDVGPMLYVPTAQVSDGLTVLLNQRSPIGWVVRTAVDPHQVATAVKNELRQIGGGLAISTIRTMDELSHESTARANFNMTVLTIFGGAALVLAAIGIYGLMAYSVQQRRQEMGIRLALGAESRQLRNLVVGQGMAVALIGVAVGIVGAFALTRILSQFLFGVTTHDPLTFALVPVVLGIVAFAGAWVPARRAARVDPMTALRAE